MHFSWCLICTIGTLVCPDLFHVNGKRGLTSIWSLIPQVATGGSNYQLVALSTACCLILSPVLSSAGYNHECLNLIYPFRISRHLLFVRHVLVSGHSGFIRFVISVFLTCKRMEDKIILLLSAASEAPKGKQVCMGRSIDVTNADCTFKPTNRGDIMAHFSSSYPPEDERLMYI